MNVLRTLTSKMSTHIEDRKLNSIETGSCLARLRKGLHINLKKPKNTNIQINQARFKLLEPEHRKTNHGYLQMDYLPISDEKITCNSIKGRLMLVPTLFCCS